MYFRIFECQGHRVCGFLNFYLTLFFCAFDDDKDCKHLHRTMSNDQLDCSSVELDNENQDLNDCSALLIDFEWRKV